MQDYSFMPSNVRQEDDLAAEIMKAINGEYTAIACYGMLATIAPTDRERKRILEIREDEVRHFHTFMAIYQTLTNMQPTPKITEHCPEEFIAGLTFAIEDEQKTVDFYLDLADKVQQPYIKAQILRAAADEQNHAVWFLYMYVQRR